KKYVKADEYRQHGEALGNFIRNSRKDIEQYRNNLENPNSLNEYYNSFPLALTSFFDGLVESIEKHKYAVSERKRRQHGQKESNFNREAIEKISAFFASVILTIAFPSWKIWLTFIMTSLCKKPKLISSLQAILHA
ncbi:1864_t:CDS:1, partial [Cetraspora pellucida]